MHLHRLEERPKNWDQLIQPFRQKSLFHESLWLDFVVSARRCLKVEYLRVERGQETVGYFCCFRSSKFNLPIWGSPFAGRTGMYLDPLLSPGEDQALFLEALNRYCSENQVAHLK